MSLGANSTPAVRRDRRQGRLFQSLLEEFAELASAAGAAALPYRGQRPDYFLALPAEDRERIFGEFSLVVATAREVVAAGEKLTNHKVFFWRMLVRLRLRPLSNFMGDIGAGDIIEVHNRQLVQIFRTLNFLQVCSYSLDELLCRPFFELFRRDSQTTQTVVDAATRALRHEDVGLQTVATGFHSIEEINGPQMRRSVVENLLLSPLFDESGQVVAVATTIHCYANETMLNRGPLAPTKTRAQGLHVLEV